VTLHALQHGKAACRENLTAETARDALALVAWFAQNQEALIADARTNKTQSLLDRIKSIAAAQGEDTERGREVTFRNLSRVGIKDTQVRQLAADHPGKYTIENRKTAGRPSLRFVFLE
jgi:hypothetical protein